MDKIFFDSRKESESNKICSNDFENIFMSKFQFYFLRIDNQYILKSQSV
jgi:hypothetical protein